MIERVYIKNYLSFDEVEIEFSKGLNVFTGPSGAGKSVLIKGILSVFGYFEPKASLSEAVVDNNLDLEKYGLENDDILIFRQIKKVKNRYFINNNALSRKTAKKIASDFIDYLSLREIKELENESILNILDKITDEKEYFEKLKLYKQLFKEYKKLQHKLQKVLKEEKDAVEKKEFLKYEIKKFEEISPKENEFEKLMKIKKDLSKVEKIKEKISEVEKVFEFENSVYELLDLIGEDGEFFSSALNELRILIEKAEEKASFLENVDIEEVLNRLSQLQEIILRFGSIQNAIEYYEKKKKELSYFENLSFEKEELIKKINSLKEELNKIAQYISLKRKKAAKMLEERINFFLKKLYMPEGKIIFKKNALNEFGNDTVEIVINGIDINTISTGELNRLRIALLASKIEYDDREKTVFLDEIDANLSGEESMSVAEVLEYISKKHQIFAISHHPQLTSKADKHFLVIKEDSKSMVKELNKDERVKEITRIIGGRNKSKKAKEYAEELLKGKNEKF